MLVSAVDGTLLDGVFTCRRWGNGFGASGPLSLSSLPRGAVVTIHVTGKSSWFSLAIASTNTLNYSVLRYNTNHHAAFHYSSVWGRVNSDAYDTDGTFAVHNVNRPFTATLTLTASDRSVSFAVNGVQQSGVWALPTTEHFYLMLATYHDAVNSIAVTDVTVTTTA